MSYFPFFYAPKRFPAQDSDPVSPKGAPYFINNHREGRSMRNHGQSVITEQTTREVELVKAEELGNQHYQEKARTKFQSNDEHVRNLLSRMAVSL